MKNYFQGIINEYINSKTKEQVDAIRKKERISFRTSAGHPTQRTNTTSTYLKFYKLLTPEEQQGIGLDYSAGLGKGSAILRQEFNANIESYEPFPHEDSEDITYSGVSSLPDKLYDYIFCSAVLNVVEQDIRDYIVQDIFAHLKPGGEAIIGVRSKADVLSARTAYVIDAENGEIIDRVRGSYQKGFTGSELREYISTILPEAAVTKVEVSGFSQIVVRVYRSEWDAYKDLTEAIEKIYNLPREEINYKYGYCHLFAYALSTITNRKINSLWDIDAMDDDMNPLPDSLVHMWVKNGKYNYDMDGKFKLNDLEYFPCNDPEYRTLTLQDIDKLMKIKILDKPKPNEIKLLIDYINNNKKKYGL